MKSIYTLIISLSVTFTSLFAQTEISTYGTLNGKIKSIEEKQFYAFVNNGGVEKRSLFYHRNLNFDDKGNEIKSKYMYSNDREQFRHVLNSQGLKIETIKYSWDGYVEYRKTFTYDAKKYLIGEKTYSSSDRLISDNWITNDEKGRPIKSKIYDENGEYSTAVTYTYQNNNLIEQYIDKVNMDNRDYNIKYKITYDDKNNITEILTQYYDGSPSQTQKFEYVQFDANNNWTYRVEYINGKPDKIVERVIVYY